MVIINRGKGAENFDIIILSELFICELGILEILSNFQESYVTKAS